VAGVLEVKQGDLAKKSLKKFSTKIWKLKKPSALLQSPLTGSSLQAAGKVGEGW
jgi:hypothetical protein